MYEEKMFYNAVAIALQGDPWRIRKFKETSGGLFDSWKTRYEYLPNYLKSLQEAKMSADENGKTLEAVIIPDPVTAWEILERAEIELIFLEDEDYPSLLRQIHDPPLALYVRGELPENQNLLSIVGTRRGTPEGKSTTKKFAQEIAEAGFVVVSGLALGIDAAAHEGCLAAGGKTIAILARGLDEIYPAENEKLGKKILANGGAIISEYPPGEPPYPYRFLERNRIVSGISKGTLVIEAPKRSGSLASATFALQQNRDVFVVPGPISHSNFFGSHWLIRQGAGLVTKSEEILEAYGFAREEKLERSAAGATNEEKQVLLALQSISTAASVDKIIEMTRLEPRIANQAITMLVIKQLVKETDMGYIIE